jgi:hypothetical protein
VDLCDFEKVESKITNDINYAAGRMNFYLNQSDRDDFINDCWVAVLKRANKSQVIERPIWRYLILKVIRSYIKKFKQNQQIEEFYEDGENYPAQDLSRDMDVIIAVNAVKEYIESHKSAEILLEEQPYKNEDSVSFKKYRQKRNSFDYKKRKEAKKVKLLLSNVWI